MDFIQLELIYSLLAGGLEFVHRITNFLPFNCAFW